MQCGTAGLGGDLSDEGTLSFFVTNRFSQHGANISDVVLVPTMSHGRPHNSVL